MPHAPQAGSHGFVLDLLGRRIASGEIPEGTVLTLAGLEQEFAASRTLIREAVRVLESLGMLRSRRRVGITVQERSAFREYVVRERIPTFTVEERVTVGATLPEAGVTYYDVPQSVASTPYRYTVVNGQTVLVEPRSRRIVQVVD